MFNIPNKKKDQKPELKRYFIPEGYIDDVFELVDAYIANKTTVNNRAVWLKLEEVFHDLNIRGNIRLNPDPLEPYIYFKN
jgi:hypothetical protein